jgi:phospholipid/cholesterol/gamma-HCH transport system substrate-binding protein
VKEADVRMAGVNVGKVKQKELGPGGRTTRVTMEIDNRFAPIGRDARAILRQKSLLGESYVEITPGSPEAEDLDDGGTLPQSQVDDTVELDEVFRVFDPDTRKAFQEWLHEAGIATTGTFARDFNDSLGNAAPFFEGGADLLRPLAEQEVALRRVVRDTGRVFDAVSREDGQLRGLITGGEATFGALASRDDALAETFQVFPTFLRETRATLLRLEAFARNTDPLVRDLREPAQDLAPTLRDLGDLSPDLETLFRHFDPLVRASRRGVPAAERFLRGAEPVLEATHVFMPELNPILSYLSFARMQLAQFMTIGGGALAGNGVGGYGGGRSSRV